MTRLTWEDRDQLRGAGVTAEHRPAPEARLAAREEADEGDRGQVDEGAAAPASHVADHRRARASVASRGSRSHG
jgi:hypothetical protein